MRSSVRFGFIRVTGPLRRPPQQSADAAFSCAAVLIRTGLLGDNPGDGAEFPVSPLAQPACTSWGTGVLM